MTRQITPMRIRLRKGDLVEVIAGKDAGKRGKVLKVIREKNRVIVQAEPSTQHQGGHRGARSPDPRV